MKIFSRLRSVALAGFVYIAVVVRGAEISTPPTGAAQTPSPAGQTSSQRTDAPLEFRGLLIDEDGEYFKITERDTQASIWLGLNETGHPFVVRRYDSRRQVVTVEYQRRRFALPLRKSLAHRKEPPRHRMVSGEETPATGEGSPALREGPSDAAPPKPAIATQTTGSIRRETIRQELDERTANLQAEPIEMPPEINGTAKKNQ
ncbi:MAG: hypothetical protein WAV89_12830 [Ignavibacteriaceae bacterium]